MFSVSSRSDVGYMHSMLIHLWNVLRIKWIYTWWSYIQADPLDSIEVCEKHTHTESFRNSHQNVRRGAWIIWIIPFSGARCFRIIWSTPCGYIGCIYVYGVWACVWLMIISWVNETGYNACMARWVGGFKIAAICLDRLVCFHVPKS